ncbi:transposase, partial [Cohnella fermenti]
MNLFAAIADRKSPSREGHIPKAEFTYDPQQDAYRCPQGQMLPYSTTNRDGQRVYFSDAEQCATCPMLSQCTSNQEKARSISRHIWEEHREQVRENGKGKIGQMLLRWRQQKIEPSFGEAKELHQYRRSKFRGRAKMQEQALLTAFAQNLKKIARYLA